MKHIFLSHASDDKPFVNKLQRALTGHGVPVWQDSRNLRGGDRLHPKIVEAIESASYFLLILSPTTVNSTWVRTELEKALEVQDTRSDGYAVIPILLSGIRPSALGTWFKEEPLAVPVELGPGGIDAAMHALLVAIGRESPSTPATFPNLEAKPVEELLLTLRNPEIFMEDDRRQVRATATLLYEPSDQTARRVESTPFIFNAPLGVIEAQDLRWYLEEYFRWPSEVFKERAKRIEKKLPQWGKAIYSAALGSNAAQNALNAWKNARNLAPGSFSIEVNWDVVEGAPDHEGMAAKEAGCALLSMPWELIHDNRSYLFHGRNGIRVRRRLPNRFEQKARHAKLPIRVLIVSPRPEDDKAGYIDHRVSARPLVRALENLGELVTITILTPPTYGALEEALRSAADRGEDYDVVHFDGHGIYDRESGYGSLCFEDPGDYEKLTNRGTVLIDALRLAALVRDHRIPVFFLEACQSAMTEADPTASVAAKLLEEGVSSVVAMSHSVLVETAKRFVEVFYTQLATGARVGQAMLASQRVLEADTRRGKVLGAGDLHLQDWFVPVLYQENHDPQLFEVIPDTEAQRLIGRARKLRTGLLPDPPDQTFVGRSRELLKLERLLHHERYAVIRGQGGSGKTTLAVEFARWLVQTNRCDRAAFVAMDTIHDVRSVLDSVGRQLIPDYSVALFPDLEKARQPIERALRESRTIFVLDNLECILPDASGEPALEAAPVGELFELCEALLEADSATRIVFTSRESLPDPFGYTRREVQLAELTRNEAVELVAKVMGDCGLELQANDPGGTPEEITELVEAVNFHARALVLIAREVAQHGIRTTTENLQKLMAEMERRHPGDRENSLYASVELSLQRLPSEVQAQAKVFAFFRGGAHAEVVARVLEIKPEEFTLVQRLGRSLISAGLATEMPNGHLRLDPALPSYLLQSIDSSELRELRARWTDGMIGLVQHMDRARKQNEGAVSGLVLLELANLLQLLEWMGEFSSPTDRVAVAVAIESLLSGLGRPDAIIRVAQLREEAMSFVEGWGGAQFEAAQMKIEQDLRAGRVLEALQAAFQLFKRSEAAGSDSYTQAPYHLAVAKLMMGRVLNKAGKSDEAIGWLREARKEFLECADDGSGRGLEMACVTLNDIATSYAIRGELEHAAEAYLTSLSEAKAQKLQRQMAVAEVNIGIIRKKQWRRADALQAFQQAKVYFEQIQEPGSVAMALREIGSIHLLDKSLDEAEKAFRESLAISVRAKILEGEVSSLVELGNLCQDQCLFEDSVNFTRQAANIFSELSRPLDEGNSRSNLGHSLLKLGRYDEARQELHRAIECKRLLGHSAQIWITFELLHLVELESGNEEAARDARRLAMNSYREYRLSGGENPNSGEIFFTSIYDFIERGDNAGALQFLANAEYHETLHPQYRPLIPKLRAVVNGDRRASIADDDALHCTDAVELTLLLEKLGEIGSGEKTD